MFAIPTIIIYMICSFILGIVFGNRLKTIRKRFQTYTDVYFIDTKKHITIYGDKETFSISDNSYSFNHEYTKNHSALFHSKCAEQLNFTIDNKLNVAHYWVDTKEFDRVYKSKVLEKMMLIAESDFIKVILVFCLLACVISFISLYKVMNLQETVYAVGSQTNAILNILNGV